MSKDFVFDPNSPPYLVPNTICTVQVFGTIYASDGVTPISASGFQVSVSIVNDLASLLTAIKLRVDQERAAYAAAQADAAAAAAAAAAQATAQSIANAQSTNYVPAAGKAYDFSTTPPTLLP